MLWKLLGKIYFLMFAKSKFKCNFARCFCFSREWASSETQGRSLGPEEKAQRKFSSTGGRGPGCRLSPAISKRSSECWLLIGHKKCFVLLCPIGEQHLLSSFREFVRDGYWPDHGLSGLCTKEMHAIRKLSVWYKLSISKYCLPEN